jgi:hypothetical protein
MSGSHLFPSKPEDVVARQAPEQYPVLVKALKQIARSVGW